MHVYMRAVTSTPEPPQTTRARSPDSKNYLKPMQLRIKTHNSHNYMDGYYKLASKNTTIYVIAILNSSAQP